MQDNEKKPALRFKGFTDPWEQRKLGELVEIGDIDHRMPETVADGIPYLMTGDFVGTNELNFDGTKMISEEDYCQLSQKIKPEKGDILFARYASVGAARYVDFTRKFLISYSCAIIKKNKKINSKYLYHFITSGKVQQQIKLEINTGSQANIGIDSMKNHIVVSMPPLEEQTKIADALSNLDHLITLHQRKYEKLVNIKKSMLDKMFPPNGASVPEIRFKGFTDPWEQRKLGELSCSFEYGLNAAAKEYDGQNKYLRITDIDDTSRQFVTTDITSPDINLTDADSYKLSDGDVLFARTGASVGKTYLYKKFDGLVYFAGFLIRAKIKESVNAGFIFQNTLTRGYERYIAITSQRSGQPGVNAQEYAEYQLMLPELFEQEKIAKLLEALDTLITLHQRKLEKLQNIKKSCLEKMFA